jgi:conjugal transfer mating pair stabilization protein TraN
MKRIILLSLFFTISCSFLFAETTANDILNTDVQRWDITFSDTDSGDVKDIETTVIEVDKIVKEIEKISVLLPRITLTGSCSSGIGCNLDSVQCDAVTEAPSCPDGSILNTTRDMCQKDPDVFDCPVGFTYDTAVSQCIKPLECLYGGTYVVERQRCESPILYDCPTGYTEDANGICVSPPICPSGSTYNSSINKCEADIILACPDGWTWNSAVSICEREPDCPSETTYSTTLNTCISDFTTTFPDGYVYNSTRNRCEASPTCSSGATYNNSTNKCEIGATSNFTWAWTQVQCRDTEKYNPEDDTCISSFTWNGVTNIYTKPVVTVYNYTEEWIIRDYIQLNLSQGWYYSREYKYDTATNNVLARTSYCTNWFYGSTPSCSVTVPASIYSANINPNTFILKSWWNRSSSWFYNGNNEYIILKKNSDSSLGCQEGEILNGNICQTSPTCPSGGSFDGVNDKCYTNIIKDCNIGVYDSITDKCIISPDCFGGLLDAASDKCQISRNEDCALGVIDTTINKCIFDSDCTNEGTLNTTTDMCKDDKIPLDCDNGTDVTLQVCYDKVNECYIDTSFPTYNTLSYSSVLKSCLVEEEVVCSTSLTWNESLKKCEAVPICNYGVYNPENDFCFNEDYKCPIDPNLECIGTEQFNHWCSPWKCNSNNQCGYAFCTNSQTPKDTSPWMLRSLLGDIGYISNSQCIGANCDVVVNRDISYCGEDTCPKGFGVYEQDNKCYQNVCPDGAFLGQDNNCYIEE